MAAKQFFFVLIGILCVSIAIIFVTFFIGSSRLEMKSDSVSNLRADLDVTQETIIRLQNSKLEDYEIESVTQLLDRLLPEQKEQDKLIADIIYTSTAEAGIPFSQVSSFSFSGSGAPDDLSGTNTSKEFPGIYEYPFTLDVEDISYDTLLKLLAEIESNGRIIQVDNILITPADLGGSSNILNVNLSMKAYLKP